MAKSAVAKPRVLRSYHLSSFVIFTFVLAWLITTLLISDFIVIRRQSSFLFCYWAASLVILFLLLLSLLWAWKHFTQHGHTFNSGAKYDQEASLTSTYKLEPYDLVRDCDADQNETFIANVASGNRLVSEVFLYIGDNWTRTFFRTLVTLTESCLHAVVYFVCRWVLSSAEPGSNSTHAAAEQQGLSCFSSSHPTSFTTSGEFFFMYCEQSDQWNSLD